MAFYQLPQRQEVRKEGSDWAHNYAYLTSEIGVRQAFYGGNTEWVLY